METIQSKLNELASRYDKRTSVFEIEIDKLTDESLTLSGRILEETQREELHRLFPDLQVESAGVSSLLRPNLPRLRVATNLTGLYEKPTFGMPLSSELYFGTELEVLDEQGRWVLTRQKDGYLGWAYKPYLTADAQPEATHVILEPAVEVRFDSSFNSGIVTRIVSGTGVTVKDTRGKWSHIVANQSGWIPSSALRAIDDMPRSLEARRNTIVEDSHRMVGVPYLWGGTSGNGIDCSGFAQLLHRWIGLEVPRDADMQCATARPVEPPFEVGDLIFFGEGDGNRLVTHVGVSLGGWTIMHSSRGRNGVYIDNVEEREGLKQIYLSGGSFLR